MKYVNTKIFLPIFLLILCSSTSLHSTQHRSLTPDAASKNDAHKLHVLLEKNYTRSETKRTLKKKVVSWANGLHN